MAQAPPHIGEIVEVVNRTSKLLVCTFDGRQYDLLPGYKVAEDGTVLGNGPDGKVFVNHLDYLKAEMAKRQNVLMGTEDPLDPRSVEHLVAIPADGDDISYVEQDQKAKERFNRMLFESACARSPEFRQMYGARSGRGPVTEGPTNFQDGLVNPKS